MKNVTITVPEDKLTKAQKDAAEIQAIQAIKKATKSIEGYEPRTTELITDYTVFDLLPSNREQQYNKVLKNDIDSLGQACAVTVEKQGEKLIVLDGQHRLLHLMELGLPVEVIHKPKHYKGDSFEAVQSFNVKNRNWTDTDFIEHYKAEKNENFIKFDKAKADFKSLTPTIIYKRVNSSKGDLKILYRTGELKFNPSESDLKHLTTINELIKAVRSARAKEEGEKPSVDFLEFSDVLSDWLKENTSKDTDKLKKSFENNILQIQKGITKSEISELYS